MSELTIDCLSTLPPEDTSKASNSKWQPVTSIIEWIQCFTNYITILGQSYPGRFPDLLGYQHLILEAHLEYSGDGWAVYNRHFRQIAAILPGSLWAQRDGDLWNMVFASSQRRPYCHHCFGSTHSSEQCSGAPDIPSRERIFTPRSRKPRICHKWNYTLTVFIPRLSVYPCLPDLLQRPTFRGQQPQTHPLPKEYQATTGACSVPSDGDPKPISTLKIYKKKLRRCCTSYMHIAFTLIVLSLVIHF